MTIKDPPNWGSDHLTDFIIGAYENSFATFVNMKPEFERLKKIDTLFRKATDCLYNTKDWFIGFFFLRSHSAYLGGARLSMSAQVYESYMVLRGCLEAALYGFYIAKDGAAKKIWLERNDSEQTLKQMKNIFKIGPILSELRQTDEKVYSAIQDLYDRTIDFGAHPNPSGVLGTLEIKENVEHVNFHMNYLTNDKTQLQLVLKTTAQVGVGALMLFRYVFPERFEIIGLYDELKYIAKDL